MTVFIIVLLGLSLGSHDPASHHVQAISVVGAICLLIVYLAWVVPYLRADSLPAAREARADTEASSGAPAPLLADVAPSAPTQLAEGEAPPRGRRSRTPRCIARACRSG